MWVNRFKLGEYFFWLPSGSGENKKSIGRQIPHILLLPQFSPALKGVEAKELSKTIS
jgi:hypothetical protein